MKYARNNTQTTSAINPITGADSDSAGNFENVEMVSCAATTKSMIVMMTDPFF